MTTKSKLLIIAAGILLMTATGCKKCKGEDPRARILNSGSKKASVQIKTSDGNTENINNVDPGAVSEYRSYKAGQVLYTVTVDKNTFQESVAVSECFDYDITIDDNNNITVKPTDRNE